MRPRRSVRNSRYWRQAGQRAGPRSATSGLRAAERFALIARRGPDVMYASQLALRLGRRPVDERVIAQAQGAARCRDRRRHRWLPIGRTAGSGNESTAAMTVRMHGSTYPTVLFLSNYRHKRLNA